MYLELISNNVVEHRENLSQEQGSIYNLKKSDIKVVYQDQDYSLFLGDIMESENTSIIINNQEISPNSYSISFSSDKKGYYISFKNQPFSLIYGITDIVIMVQIDGVETFYYSPFFAVAIKQGFEETMNSIREMLDNIYLKDHRLLQSEKQQNKFDKKLRNKKLNQLECEIKLLKEIIISLNQNSTNFINNPKTVPINVQNVDNFEKLRKVSSANIGYMANHPNELYKSNTSTGINVEGEYYHLRKTLVSTISSSKDTMENRAVVSFINMLFSYVIKRIQELENQFSSNFDNVLQNTIVRSGYIISFVIMEQYLKFSFKDYLEELETLSVKLRELLMVYKRNLIDTKEFMRAAPQPTSTFLEVYHYRRIYEYMVQWFSFTKPDIPNQSTIIHFHTADRIYEYYCLLNLIDVLEELGFNEDIKRRTFYSYDVENYNSYLPNCKYNTFIFEKDGKVKVTLYYQPIVYSKINEKRNNITLFRTDYSSYPYFTPDFIIKITNEDHEQYGIIDAKWRNRNTLTKKTTEFRDCIYKYFASVADENTSKPVSFMWLLQGKDDTQRIYYHQNGAISKKQGNTFVNSIGIVPFTPKSGTSEMLKILNQILY